jgi:hypothetical protein
MSRNIEPQRPRPGRPLRRSALYPLLKVTAARPCWNRRAERARRSSVFAPPPPARASGWWSWGAVSSQDKHAVFGNKMGWERPNYFAADAEAASTAPVFSWGRPSWFEAQRAEAQHTRSAVSLFDQSSFGECTCRPARLTKRPALN